MNLRNPLLVSVATLVWSGFPTAFAQNLTEAKVREQAESLITDRIADGLSIGYIQGDHYGIVHLGSAGVSGAPANNRTLYEIGSISKVFTSLLLADAVVRGQLELNEKAVVQNQADLQLPSHAERPIRWLDLSTHRSGLPRLPSNMDLNDLKDPYRNYDSKKAAAFLSRFQLPRRPGDEQEYSNFAVSVLGYLIGERAGMSYEELLSARITKPLGMKDCTISLNQDQVQRMATPHVSHGSSTSSWTFADMPGAGGIRATMRDMMRFAKAQLSPPSGQLGQAIELAWKQHTEADQTGPPMGLGWLITPELTRWHNGQTGGFHSSLFISRKTGCAVVVLCNTAAEGVDELAIRLMAIAAGQAPPVKKSGPAEAVDAKIRKRIEGKYRLAANFVFDVREHAGHMMVGITNQPTQEVFPESDTVWAYRSVDAKLEFQLGTSGPARSLILHQNGIKQTARRVR